MYCEVHILDVPYHLDRPFDYECDSTVAVGDLVRVPFGKANNARIARIVVDMKGELEKIREQVQNIE